MRLTRKKAVELHREMWTAMQEAPGNKNGIDRMNFKYRWLNVNGYIGIKNDCFLCAYAKQVAVKKGVYDIDTDSGFCQFCPIDWRTEEERDKHSCEYITEGKDFACQSCRRTKGCAGKIDWRDTPISEILALPER